MKKCYFFVSLFLVIGLQVFSQPTTNAPIPPARNASNVISVYSDSYTSLTGTDFNPNWGQSGFATASEINISGNNIRKYANINYQGVQFASPINASSMTNLHLDIWTSDCTSFDVYPIVAGQPEQFVTVTPTASGWKSVDIPLSSYTIPLSNIIQFKFVSTPFGGPTVYLDNIYFWTAATLPTITGFTMPSNKKVGDAPFTITAPTSNSAGAFSYSSSNVDVATISGNTITITGSGSTTINVSQAANGIYSAGSASATLVVGYNPPMVAAPIPSTPSSNVISLYSNSYTNRTIDTWSAVWDQADVLDTVIAGNDTKKYYNLVYSGIEFTGANSINATAMNFLHVDIWTPNSSPIKLKLVDFGPNNVYGGGDDKNSIEYVLSPAPTPSTWTSYDIPLSSFTGLDTKANLSQMLFVGSNTVVYFDNLYLSSTMPLPVNLVEFKAVKLGSVVQLGWKTLSETNNKGFSIERSSDGIVWNQIQFVNAAGAGSYSAIDNSPLNGVNYYRLKQVDVDGKSTYSATVSVNFTNNNAVAFTFYPNPAKDKIMVSLQNIQSTNASLSLVNVDGKTVKSVPLNSQQSNSTIQISVSDIAKGNYFLVLKDDSTTKSSKVLVE